MSRVLKCYGKPQTASRAMQTVNITITFTVIFIHNFLIRFEIAANATCQYGQILKIFSRYIKLKSSIPKKAGVIALERKSLLHHRSHKRRISAQNRIPNIKLKCSLQQGVNKTRDDEKTKFYQGDSRNIYI
jgi:hypothetical protein